MHSSDSLTRRDLLKYAALGSAAIIVPTSHFADRRGYQGAFHELEPGEVIPEGWLKSLLQRQASELGSKLPQVSWPFTWPYWNGETRTEGTESYDVWGPWEQSAYWIDGATRLGILLGDEQLIRQATAPIEYTLRHPREDGYLGPQNFADPAGEYYRWPHTVFFRGAMALAGYKRDQAIASAIARHYLVDRADYGVRTRGVTNVEVMLWTYERTRDPRLLALAERTWRTFVQVRAIDQRGDGDLAPQRVFADLPIKSHGVSYAEQSKLPFILYLHTGDRAYLDFALAAQKRIFDHHMLVDGIPSTSEFYAANTGRDAHETCDIADHMWSWGYAIMATGDGIWGDRIERACFNAAMGAIHKDWKGLQYMSSPNQVIATPEPNYVGGADRFDYAPNPAKHIACCAGNVHRILPNYAIRMWMRTANGLAATLYGPCRLKTTVAGRPIEICEETDYPFREHIKFTIQTEQPIEFPLSLRLPAWCRQPSLNVNGRVVGLPPAHSGFFVLRRRFAPGDAIELSLPMSTAVSHWPENGVALERGPLVYSLPVQTDWTSAVDAHWSTVEFPIWSAKPMSRWNFAFAPEDGTLEQRARFELTDSSSDPWLEPPVHLRVPVKLVRDWKIEVDPGNPRHQSTPPLPSRFSLQDREETVTLVPLGTTHLRMTVLPIEEAAPQLPDLG